MPVYPGAATTLDNCSGGQAAHALRSLAPDAQLLTAGEKSPVTGDCHAGIRGSPGVRFPRATRRWSPVLVDDAPPYMARGVAYRWVAGRAGKAKAVIP